MTKVKICGITNLEDAQLSVDLGADMIGFNFWPQSKRFVDEGYAESVVERLVGSVIKVGVFVDQSLEDIIDAEGIAELDVIQLHGDESPEFIRVLRNETDAEIIKVFRVTPGFDCEVIHKYSVDGIMLDSFSKADKGGTGKTFDWNVASTMTQTSGTLYLAGGLNPENVNEAIRRVRPFAVDVASGVESEPGKKDPKKVEEFIKNAKNA